MDWNNIEEIDEEQLLKESEELQTIRYLTKDNASFTPTPGGFLSLDYQDKHYDRVFIYRTFPDSEPERFLSVREADEKAKEIGLIEDLKQFEPEQMQMIREQLDMRYYMPVIQKVLEVKDEYGYAYFQVETNYGRCRFAVQMGGSNVLHMGGWRYQITDLDGNRYILEDLSKLSASEQKKLDLYL